MAWGIDKMTFGPRKNKALKDIIQGYGIFSVWMKRSVAHILSNYFKNPETE